MENIQKAIADLGSLHMEKEEHVYAVKAGIQALEFVNKLLDDWDIICNRGMSKEEVLTTEGKLNQLAIDSVYKLAGDYFAHELSKYYKQQESEDGSNN